jgi:hypothetical protein
MEPSNLYGLEQRELKVPLVRKRTGKRPDVPTQIGASGTRRIRAWSLKRVSLFA